MPIHTVITCNECGKPAQRVYALPIKYGGPTIEIGGRSDTFHTAYVLCFRCPKKAILRWFDEHSVSSNENGQPDMIKLSEADAEHALTNELGRALDEKKSVILVTFEEPGVLFTGVRTSGIMHIQAAVKMLSLADDKSAPAKVRHHLEQAIIELKKIDVNSGKGKHGK